MKWSKYNILTNSKDPNIFFLFNTISSVLYELSKEEYDLFLSIKNNNSKILDLEISTIEELKLSKVIVEDDRIDYLTYKLNIQSERYKNEILLAIELSKRMIRSHSGYNFIMNKDLQNDIIDFVRINGNYEVIHLVWIVNNLTISFNSILYITEKLKCITDSHIKAEIITDSIAFYRFFINDLRKIGVFKLVVEINSLNVFLHNYNMYINRCVNIDVLSRFLSISKISIEVVINKINILFDEFVLIIDALSQFNKCISINITDSYLNANVNNSFFSTCENLHPCCIKELLDTPLKKKGECIARKINGYIVDFDGFIFKCWSDFYEKKNMIAHMTDKSSYNIYQYIKYLSERDPFEDVQCQNCSIFPVCGGGCPKVRFNTDLENIEKYICDPKMKDINLDIYNHYNKTIKP